MEVNKARTAVLHQVEPLRRKVRESHLERLLQGNSGHLTRGDQSQARQEGAHPESLPQTDLLESAEREGEPQRARGESKRG